MTPPTARHVLLRPGARHNAATPGQAAAACAGGREPLRRSPAWVCSAGERAQQKSAGPAGAVVIDDT